MPGDWVCIEKTADEDVCIPILILPHYFNPMGAPLLVPHDLVNWGLEVLQSADHYTVTEATYTKSRSPLQHEYVRLVVQGPGNLMAIRIERNIRGNGVPGWVGLWGTAADTVTLLGPPQPSDDNRLHSLRWEGVVAPPTLRHILSLVLSVKRNLPRFCLAKTSCYSFAKATFLSINEIYHHNAEYSQDPPRWYSKECHLLGIISAGSRRAQRAAEIAAEEHTFYTAFPLA